MGKKKKTTSSDSIALNRKAKFEFSLEETFEAGIVLEGWEVKSLRAGKCGIADAHVIIRKTEAWLLNAQILPLLSASTHVHPEPNRTRKLLLHRKELNRLIGAVERQGYTLIPLKMYWKNGLAKVTVAIAKGKKLHDKRQSVKERDWQRQKQRLAKQS